MHTVINKKGTLSLICGVGSSRNYSTWYFFGEERCIKQKTFWKKRYIKGKTVVENCMDKIKK